MLQTISVRYVYFFILLCYNDKFGINMLYEQGTTMQILVSIGLVVTELCCHKINMNTKEKHIIRRIIKEGGLHGGLLWECSKLCNILHLGVV